MSWDTNKASVEYLNRAKKHMPLGVADSYRYWGDEDTVCVDTMENCRFIDIDGREYVDFRLAYGPIILGYRDSRIDDAVVDTIRNKGSMVGFSTSTESDVAELIKEMCPQIEKLRFANSGTEAVFGAVRTARGYTGKNMVVIVEGGFHGLYDEMMWKLDVENWEAEKETDPRIIPFGIGLPEQSKELMHWIPLNCEKSLTNIFETYGDQIAAVVIEPIMGNCGSISATQQYMEKLRSICDTHSSMLVIDEVKTGFRVAKGGVQELYGVYADLTTYAKAMGNGYAVAAFGGRAEVMDKIHFGEGGVTHGGTYTANLVGIAAAKATLTVLKETEALKTIEHMGEKIKEVLSEVFTHYGLEHSFAGHSSMFGVHFSKVPPTDYRTWKPTNSKLYAEFAWNLIRQGVMLEPDSREPWFICEAHQNIDLDMLREKSMKAMGEALKKFENKIRGEVFMASLCVCKTQSYLAQVLDYQLSCRQLFQQSS